MPVFVIFITVPSGKDVAVYVGVIVGVFGTVVRVEVGVDVLDGVDVRVAVLLGVAVEVLEGTVVSVAVAVNEGVAG